MTRLSVNINKVALIRNARGSNWPDLIQIAKDCEKFGAEGITVHPRPDQRHVRYDDIPLLKEIVTTEFNIEGNPSKNFLNLVMANAPHQCTLVPDAPDALTSDAGWDTIKHKEYLKDTISQLHEKNIRVSIFMETDEKLIEGAKEVGADRIEFYTGPYAHDFSSDKHNAIKRFSECAQFAHSIGLGINAGHDLNLDNLRFFCQNTPHLLEVSIGHALISDALYMGLETTVQKYLTEIQAAK